jgi:hypothetical protein
MRLLGFGKEHTGEQLQFIGTKRSKKREREREREREWTFWENKRDDQMGFTFKI